MVKSCKSCKKEKALHAFGRAKKAPYDLHKRCKECVEKGFTPSARKSKKIVEIQNWLGEYLLEHPCVDCGNKDILVLEFDHVRGDKKDNINILMRRDSLEGVKEEVDKCDVRCVNCHRKKTNREKANGKDLL